MKRLLIIIVILIVILIFLSFRQPMTQKEKNIKAFLKVIQFSEGTLKNLNPYAVTFGFSFVIRDFSDHPANLGTWQGGKLSNSTCANAGQPSGCVSTAAGAYQIIRPTWNAIKKAYPNIRFNSEGQDKGAIHLITKRKALADLENGKFYDAIAKLNKEWASLPGSPYGQPTKKMQDLVKVYTDNGGVING